MNLQQIKEDHAKELGYTDFEELFSECAHTGVDIFIDLIAKKYACEMVKESLRAAARNVGVIFHDGTTKQETHHSQVMSGNNIIKPNRGGIIALETELLNQINKEG
jgi:hypothetical protein